MNIPGRPNFTTSTEFAQQGAEHEARMANNGGYQYNSPYQYNGPYQQFTRGDSDGKQEPLTVDSSDGVPLIKHDSETTLNWRSLECGYCLRFRGMMFGIASALFFSFQALLVAKIRHVHFTQITFFRMLVQALCITPVLVYKKQSFIGPKEERLKLLFRGILGTISMGGVYYAIQKMPLGEASVIRFSCPAFVAIMAFFILRESCGIFEFIIIILTFSGVVLIAQPPFVFGDLHQTTPLCSQCNNTTTTTTTNYFQNISSNINISDKDTMNLSAILSDINPREVILTPVDPSMDFTIEGRLVGSATALVAAVAGSGVHILLRKLREVNAATVVFTYSVLGTVISAFLATCVQGWNFILDGQTWAEQLAVGVFAVIAQLCFTLALQEENAGTISVLRTTEIVFAFIYQTELFNLYPNVYSILGAVLISCCAISHGVRKWYVSRFEFENLK